MRSTGEKYMVWSNYAGVRRPYSSQFNHGRKKFGA